MNLVLDTRPMAQDTASSSDLLPAETAVLGMAQRVGVAPAVEAELMRGVGMLLYRSGLRDAGRAQVRRAVEIAYHAGALGAQCNALRNLSRLASLDGDSQTATALARECVALSRMTGEAAAEVVCTRTSAGSR